MYIQFWFELSLDKFCASIMLVPAQKREGEESLWDLNFRVTESQRIESGNEGSFLRCQLRGENAFMHLMITFLNSCLIYVDYKHQSHFWGENNE